MKITLSRSIELSKIASTEAYKQCKEAFDYFAEVSEQVVRALTNQLTFSDNFDAKVVTVTLVSARAQSVNTNARRPVGIIPLQVVSVAYGWDSFSWYVDADGSVKVKMGFTGSPGAEEQVSVVLLIVYG